jgi:hypothetical protein
MSIREINIKHLNHHEEILTNKDNEVAQKLEAAQGCIAQWKEWYADHPVLVPSDGKLYLVFEEKLEYQEVMHQSLDGSFHKQTSFRFPGDGDEIQANWWFVNKNGKYVVCKNENHKCDGFPKELAINMKN